MPNRKNEWRSPTEAELNSPFFKAIWEAIRSWDVNVPGQYSGYCGANGNHVCAILDSVKKNCGKICFVVKEFK